MGNEKTSSGIYTKILAIMKSIDAIPKDGYNDFHKYKFASDFAIKSHVRKAMMEHNIILHTTIEEVKRESYTTKRNEPSALTTVKINYSFIDVESGESLDGSCYGQGEDMSDKGVYKAITGALKYLLTSTFLIPTGDDPEKDEADKGKDDKGGEKKDGQKGTVPPNPATQELAWITAEQVAQVVARINKGEVDAIDKAMKAFKISKVNKQVLDKALETYKATLQTPQP